MYIIERKGQRITEGKPVICVPVVGRTKEEIISAVRALADKGAAMIEWRADYFQDIRDIQAVRELFAGLEPLVEHVMLLFTFRTKKQGGEAELEETALKRLYALAAESRAVDFIDIEYFEAEEAAGLIAELKQKGVLVIASQHDFAKTPSEEKMYVQLRQMADGGADIVKLAVMPKEPEDVLSLLSVTAKFRKDFPDVPLITMSMGRYGIISRISGEVFGSCVTFGACGQTSAPGQLQMDKLDTILTYLDEAYGSRE